MGDLEQAVAIDSGVGATASVMVGLDHRLAHREADRTNVPFRLAEPPLKARILRPTHESLSPLNSGPTPNLSDALPLIQRHSVRSAA
jgi:hypothetical protein